MTTIVLSATNLYLGGPLTVGREFLAALCASPQFTVGELHVTIFCHRRSLYPDIADHPNLEWIEKPKARRTWLHRIVYEYIYYAWWSRLRQVDCWISLQDVTPRVTATHRIVYCHNPAPFYSGPSNWRMDPRLEIFRIFYRIFYRINLAENRWVVVQQQWLREAFARDYGRPESTIIVAHPVFVEDAHVPAPPFEPGGTVRLVYAAFPRSFKNCELLVQAMEQLKDLPIELTLTFSGEENAYARRIRKMAKGLPKIEFTGFLSRSDLELLYKRSDVLLFPSKLETWGLPLSEFRRSCKPIIAADLPYAREVLAGYTPSVFVSPDSPGELASLLRSFQKTGTLPYSEREAVVMSQPFAANWNELVDFLLKPENDPDSAAP